MLTPYDYNEALGHRRDSVEEKLRQGSPVVGIAYTGGLLLLTVRHEQRKVYELYDRQMFSAIGMQSDIENLRLAVIQQAHQEGFERSPDDVSLQRLVGFYLSPALKKALGDQWSGMPYVIRALFAEIGRVSDRDIFFTLNYDGEFRQQHRYAVISGSAASEEKMLARLAEAPETLSRDEAIPLALSAWILGAREISADSYYPDDDASVGATDELAQAEADNRFLQAELKSGTLEVGILERKSNRETQFRILSAATLEPFLKPYLLGS